MYNLFSLLGTLKLYCNGRLLRHKIGLVSSAVLGSDSQGLFIEWMKQR